MKPSPLKDDAQDDERRIRFKTSKTKTSTANSSKTDSSANQSVKSPTPTMAAKRKKLMHSLMKFYMPIVRRDRKFTELFAPHSLFFLGCGSFTVVFRCVTQVEQVDQEFCYPSELLKYLRRTRPLIGRTREALKTNRYNDGYLDLVALKFEFNSRDEFRLWSSRDANLIREFLLLQRIFHSNDKRYAPVGFPLPITFGFVGNDFMGQEVERMEVTDEYGLSSTYQQAFINHPLSLVRASEVTSVSYMAVELMGPSLEQLRDYSMCKKVGAKRNLFSIETVFKLMDQLLCRLIVLHRTNIVNLDLKLSNLCMGNGKNMDVLYLIDFNLARICTNKTPKLIVGNRRYMSVAAYEQLPSNYLMDIESWFYLLTDLLIDYLPWSDDALFSLYSSRSKFDIAWENYRMKKKFWRDDGVSNQWAMKSVTNRLQQEHKGAIGIENIYMAIYHQIFIMRRDFYHLSYRRMHASILNEESSLYRHYAKLRKKLLCIFNCNFFESHGCFSGDQELLHMQKEQERQYCSYPYKDKDLGWMWDWDVWYRQFCTKGCSRGVTEEPIPMHMNGVIALHNADVG